MREAESIRRVWYATHAADSLRQHQSIMTLSIPAHKLSQQRFPVPFAYSSQDAQYSSSQGQILPAREAPNVPLGWSKPGPVQAGFGALRGQPVRGGQMRDKWSRIGKSRGAPAMQSLSGSCDEKYCSYLLLPSLLLLGSGLRSCCVIDMGHVGQVVTPYEVKFC